MNIIQCTARSLTSAAAVGGTNILAGTVPLHGSYVFLHTPQPPAEYPPRMSSAVQRALQLNILKLGGLVNFSWSADQALWSDLQADGAHATDTHHYATAFTLSGRLDLEVSVSNIDAVVDTLQNHSDKAPYLNTRVSDCVYLYVCTHGARDCRCGSTGGLVAQALREEIANRGLESRVKVAEVGHVGGHK